MKDQWDITELDWLTIRIAPELKEVLRKVCKARGEDMSSFVRITIALRLAELSYLDPDRKKALGIKV